MDTGKKDIPGHLRYIKNVFSLVSVFAISHPHAPLFFTPLQFCFCNITLAGEGYWRAASRVILREQHGCLSKRFASFAPSKPSCSREAEPA